MKAKAKKSAKGPIEVVKEGSIAVPICATNNRIYRPDPKTGKRALRSEHPQFTLVYYEGARRVKRKFTSLDKARQQAGDVIIKIANGESEALKLTGLDRSRYVSAAQTSTPPRPCPCSAWRGLGNAFTASAIPNVWTEGRLESLRLRRCPATNGIPRAARESGA